MYNVNFFLVIENELRKAMGPIAPVIVDDKLAEFGESRDSFPEERMQSFVQAISEEIRDESKRTRFIRAMEEFLAEKRNFFLVIENELKKVMGPIAPVIVDDKLAEFGESRDSFPEERMQSFVQAISEEIRDESKRTRFIRAALLAASKCGAPLKKYVDANFIPTIEDELRKTRGVIARVVVADKLAEFGESKHLFPEERMQSFVQAISEEIRDESKRTGFIRAMEEFLAKKQH